ncbi:MAG: SMP-30/gluconolactonase/LRE family protein [Pseudomonadota bacterium]
MTVGLDQISFVGSGLCRPECVLAHRSGLLIAPDWTEPGGIAVVTPDGQTRRILAERPAPGIDLPLRPNGIALEPGGTLLLAHLGAETGGIYRLWPDGRCAVVTDSVDGRPMPPANFVAIDRQRRLWITVSTTKIPRALDYRPDAETGFIAIHDEAGTRQAATGLGYTNECLLSADERTLWVNETFARRLTAFDIDGDRLTNRRLVTRFGPGTFPDGLVEAADGSLLVTSIVSNRVIRVWPDGSQDLLLEDVDRDHLDRVETAFREGQMGRPHLDTAGGRRLANISNLAFGGADLTTAYLGCLLGSAIACFDSPVAGRPLPHWDAEIDPLARFLEETS